MALGAREETPSKPSGQATLLSLVVPVFNEEESVELFVEQIDPELKKILETLGVDARIEIVFIDDGSYDRTVEMIRDLSLDHATVRLVKLSRNFGKDAAVAAGFAQAMGDAVVPMDVDLQDPPDLLHEMVTKWISGAKIVNAVRTDRTADSWIKRSSSAAFYRLFNRLSPYPVPTNVGDFRLIDRQAVDIINKIPERVRFNKGLIPWLGFETEEVFFTRPRRETGTTKWKAWALWNFALDGITGSSTLPLRIWSYFGGICAILALVYSLFIIVQTMIYGVDIPGYASLLVVVLTLGSVNLIALGILGEYIGRISIEVRQRPLYLIDYVSDISGQDSPEDTVALRKEA